MAPRLQYFFSTGSRYSFLSMSQVPALERRFGVSFDWIPVNGKRIRQLRGVDPFAGPLNRVSTTGVIGNVMHRPGPHITA